ncbi:laccase-1 [Belonocnema kinseyi]|uniref:laccase-1 n=1 Tax=Belonocnema kinseyi TaxID=2817044 RepID=UPI00143D28C2|nr:laccase-1 [Belonocnema kinseyi]
MVDWMKHPCRRACKSGEAPMECRYKFIVESYHTMSKACYNCPRNMTDCYRPHCITADGVERPIVVVNRQMPGPSLEVCKGDRVIVDVTNMMSSESTTMHWHGQHHRTTPYMDGVPFITQCPILPGNTFRYHYEAATEGTHFWHSHIGFQRGDGILGSMIVRVPPEEDYHKDLYDEDTFQVIITDWEHSMGGDTFLNHYHTGGSNKPPNILINGLGRYASNIDVNGTSALVPVATYTVKQNLRYKFRLINAEFLNCPIQMTIDNHTFYVVSSDGNDIEPIEAQSLVTYAGERYDFIVEMNQEVGNYWMHFRGLLDCGESFTKAYQVAILHYEGAEQSSPHSRISWASRVPNNVMEVNGFNKGTESDTISVPMFDSLQPDDPANTREPDYQFYVTYDFYNINNPLYHRKNLYAFDKVKRKHQVYTPQLNHISMKPSSFPLLPQRDLIDPNTFCNETSMKDVKDCKKEFCSCTHVLQVKLNSVVEIILVDEGVTYDANHPFHLHGYGFRVMAMERVGKSTTVEEVKKLDREGRIKRKLHRAPIKDTVTVPDGGFTILRFYADNPGYWLFHCHIEFHAEVGMALVFKVGEHEEFPPVPKDFPRCESYMPSVAPEDTVNPQTSIYELNRNRTKNTITTPNPEENEVDNVKKVIKTWLPLVLRELGVQSSASTSVSQRLVLGLSFILVRIKYIVSLLAWFLEILPS